MGENVRLIEVEAVNYVGIRQRFQEKQVVIRRPTSPGRDYRVLRGSLADRRRQLGLHTGPAVSVLQFRFVEDLEENELCIQSAVMLRKGTPEVSKSLDESVIFGKPGFEFHFRVYVQYDCQTIGEDAAHGLVQIAQKLRLNCVRFPFPKHRLRIDAQPHVVKAHCLDQRNVG